MSISIYGQAGRSVAMLRDSPLLVSALTALELEAKTNPDAARLLAIIENLPPFSRSWYMIEALNHFDGCVRSRPALLSVVLRELSAAFPVPMSLMQ
jgi:hypothetical protein